MREAWNVVAAVAAVLAVAVSVFVFVQDKNDKRQRLEFHQVARTTLVNPALSTPSRRVEISYNGRAVPDFAVFQFRVSNIGGQPIRTADYEVPLSITFAGVSEVLWADQTSADPAALKLETKILGKAVGLSNSLLNPSDWFVLEVAVVPEPGKVPFAEIGGRIAGVKQIEYVLSVPSLESDSSASRSREWLKYVMYAQAALLILAMLLQWRQYRKLRL